MSAYIQTVCGSDSPPIGAVMDFAGNVEPSGWLFCFGQALPKVGIYADLFGVIGTLYGGDATNFNLPDFRGRVGAGKDNMGGTAANRLQTAWGVDGAVLGANGGAQSHQLTVAQMPLHSHSTYQLSGSGAGFAGGSGSPWISSNTANTGGDGAHPNIQPTFVVNKIIKYTIAAVVLPIVPGTGDVTGPDGGVADGDFAVFNGTSGKVIKRAGNYRPSGVIIVNSTTISSLSGANQLVATIIPANTLSRDGDSIRITTILACAVNGNTKIFSLNFGGTGLYTSTGLATSGTVHWTWCLITRQNAGAQRVFTGVGPSPNWPSASATTLSLNMSNALSYAINTNVTAAGDMLHYETIVEFLPGP